MSPIPITIVTGFLGSGKTTLLLNLIPQLPETYRLALLKNEFGDVAIDSQLASSRPISGVRELLNGCICCNLVGQLSDALDQLRTQVNPDRIVIETSGSAFPATLAMEVNRLSREQGGSFLLDGVISVIDVENWQGYEDTSYTAKLQARYTDLIIFNKWEYVDELRFDICLDRVGDLEIDTPWVKSDRGAVDKGILLGIDGALLSKDHSAFEPSLSHHHHHHNDYDHAHHEHKHDHQAEVEVLSVKLKSEPTSTVDIAALETLLRSAPKEEVYRIKGIVRSSAANPPAKSNECDAPPPDPRNMDYILNWAFTRWTFTPSAAAVVDEASDIARLTMILARYESAKWKKKLETGGFVQAQGNEPSDLTVERLL